MKATRKIAFAFAILIVASSICVPAHAVLDDYIEKFANNNIVFYNPEECGGISSTGLAGNNVKEKIWNYFRGKGLSEAQVSGILGNAYQESRFVVTANSEKNSNYWGIFQFSKSIAKDLFDKIKSAGLGKYLEKAYWSNDKKVEQEAPGTVDRILQIVLDYSWNDWYKHRGGPYGDWRKTIKKSADEAKGHEPEWSAEVFVRDFEGGIENNSKDDVHKSKYYHPGTYWQHVSIRRDNAVKFFKELSGKTMAAAGENNGECCDPNGTKTTYMKYPGDSYDMTEAQIAAIARYFVANKTTSNKSYAMSLVSFMVNAFEKEKGQGKTALELVKYITGKSEDEINKASFSNSSLISGIKEVVGGTRILPSQIYTSVKTSGAKATNYGKDVSGKADQYLRGITHISNGGKEIIFWDWSSPGKKSSDIYGYLESDPPSSATVAESAGTGKGKTNSAASWDNGWIKSGIAGYEKDAVSSSDYTSYSTGSGPNKIMLLATESSSAGKKPSSNYKKSSSYYPPHFTVDMKNKKVYQHAPISKSAAAADGDADAYAGVQIAIVGYANSGKSGDSNYLGKKKNFSDDNYSYLYSLINAISIETGIPFTSTVDWSSSSALTGENAKNYKGILGLKHLSNSNTKDVPKVVWEELSAAQVAAAKKNAKVCPDPKEKGDVAALQAFVLKVAWPKNDKNLRGTKNRKQEYADLIKKGVWYSGGCSGNDCGGFVTTVMRESGWDKGYNPGKRGTAATQLPYLRSSSKWQDVTAQIKSNKDAKPGDVIISKHHTLLYVGDIPGFSGKMASASVSYTNCDHSRPPMADGASDIYRSYAKHDYYVFRKVQ